MCILPLTANSMASEAVAASKRPQRSHLTSELNQVTSTTLVSICILPLTAILVASEAMAASKRPQRSHLTSEFNSVTSITYVPMFLWLLTVTIHLKLPESQTPSIDFVPSTEVKRRARAAGGKWPPRKEKQRTEYFASIQRKKSKSCPRDDIRATQKSTPTALYCPPPLGDGDGILSLHRPR